MKALLILGALAVAVPTASLACPGCNEKEHAHAQASTAPAAAPVALAPGEARVTIPVTGMHCSHCAARVQTALTGVQGVKTASADLDQQRAVVTFESGKVELAKLVAAIDAAGFKAGTPVQN
jgi:copper chaperone CopZ